jgi:hypothetical protein
MDMEVASVHSASEMPMERILGAEDASESFYSAEKRVGETGSTTREKMLHQLLGWAKQIPHFNDLKTEDQVGFYPKL